MYVEKTGQFTPDAHTKTGRLQVDSHESLRNLRTVDNLTDDKSSTATHTWQHKSRPGAVCSKLNWTDTWLETEKVSMIIPTSRLRRTGRGAGVSVVGKSELIGTSTLHNRRSPAAPSQCVRDHRVASASCERTRRTSQPLRLRADPAKSNTSAAKKHSQENLSNSRWPPLCAERASDSVRLSFAFEFTFDSTFPSNRPS
eukprot:1267478-Rhodomonas_salina.1